MENVPPPPPPPRRRPMSDGVEKDPHRAGNTGARKKGSWVRAWLLVEQTGEVRVIETGKHSIMQRTGIPARDLRVIDPALAHPSTILGRDRAIVVNLEHIKAIITHQMIMFLNSKDPLMCPLVQKLQGIFHHRHSNLSPQEAGTSNIEGSNLYEHQRNVSAEWQVPENANENQLLPFEFVALEACFECACSTLDNEAKRMEEEVHTALDKLTTKISTLNLELVRNIKSRLVALTGRVQKVRDELENLLDDEEDMAGMYLTDKFERQRELENGSSFSANDEHSSDDEEEANLPPDIDNRQNSIRIDTNEERNADERYIKRLYSGNAQSFSSKRFNVEGLEMILEPYFVQIEGTVHKLSNLREYVDDTEDYINIMLDDKQNNLLQMGVLLSTATMVTSAFVALAGVFGMNIHIDLFDSSMTQFVATVAGGTIGSLVIFFCLVAWYKYKKFLQ